MNTTSEDARLLFHKWQEESLPVRIRLLSSSLLFQGIGTVTAHSLDSLQLGGEKWAFTVPLSGVTYSFADPREIPIAAIRAAELARYEMGLSLKMPSGDELALMELKRAQEPEQD